MSTLAEIRHTLDTDGVVLALLRLGELPDSYQSAIRLLACDMVEPAMKHTTDPRPREALDTARAFARGEASLEELDAAKRATRSAIGCDCSAWATAHAARAAGVAAATFVVRDKSGVEFVAWEAAGAVAEGTAPWNTVLDVGDAAWDAAYRAARSAARKEQERILRRWLDEQEEK